MFHIESLDGKNYQIEKTIINHSLLLTNILNITDPSFPIKIHLNSSLIEQIIDFFSKSKLPLINPKKYLKCEIKITKEIDFYFQNLSCKQLEDLFVGANYFNIGFVLECCAREVVFRCKNKSFNEKKEIFCVNEDLEKKELMKKLKVCRW